MTAVFQKSTHDLRSEQIASPLDGSQFRRVHPISGVGKAAILAYLVITIAYFSYRIPLWNPESPVLSLILLAAELFGTMTLLLHVFNTWSLIERRSLPVPKGYEADILITTWNESRDILRHTLLAAKQVRHVRDVWLLDDGCRPEMEELAAELGVRYLKREDRSHAKAGNLNNALKFTTAPYLAIFDCDHAPSPDFLERTLGYFIDPKVAFVQTPQDFYNIDSFQHRGSAATKEAWHEQTLFYRVIQPGKDRWNSTFFCGSCAIMRKAALEEIGGIATGTITEDMHTSLRLHKKGWSAVYHAEALAFGLSPANLEQYETQRLRWGRGAMQVWLKEGILFRGGKMSLAQRLNYLTSAITYFEGWQKAVVYFMPMVVILTGNMPIIWTGWPFVGIFLMWFCAGMLVNESFSRGYAKTLWMEEYNFLRYYTFIKATLALVIPIKWRFSVTPKGMESAMRVPTRLWPQMVVAIGALTSMPLGIALYQTYHHMPEGAFIANIFWLVINAFIAIKALSFALKRLRQRRGGHRFPLPLMIDLDGGATSISEDISSNGMSFALPLDASIGESVKGHIALPAGPLAFSATVLRRSPDPAHKRQVIGVRFDWAHEANADALDQCLYGNDLQWDANSWIEVRPRSLRDLVLRRNVEAPRWQVGEVAHGRSRIRCVMRREGEAWRILSIAPLPADADLSVVSDMGKQDGLHPIGYREYSIGGAPIHLAVLAEEQVFEARFHREPSWMPSPEGANA